MELAQLRRIHGLLSQMGWMTRKVSLVRSFSLGRTDSIKELDRVESGRLEKFLQDEKKRRCGPMIGYIIHLLTNMGYSTSEGNPDYKRINAFVENIGSRNPKRRKNIHQLHYSELPGIVTQIEEMYKKESFKF